MKLLVVENTGKASRLLEVLRKSNQSSEWEVISCDGHYAGLPVDSLGFNPKKEFSTSWKPLKFSAFKRVKSAIASSDEVYAATNSGPDGEYIAFQISLTCKKESKKFSRVYIDLSDPSSFSSSLLSASGINESVCGGYLAREAVDRFVRYKLGPVISDRLGSRSLERLPSLILTELARRERKVRRFTSDKGWVAKALLSNGSIAESSMVSSEAEAEELVNRCKAAEPAYFSTSEKQDPLPPFTTSTLLQFLSSRYGFLPSYSTNMCATLYGLGYITDPFTDSTGLPSDFVDSVRSYIDSHFGVDLTSDIPRTYQSKVKSQETAIRPVDINVSPSKSNIRGDLLKLYSAVWFNSIGSQGESALVEHQECKYYLPGNTHSSFSAKGLRLSYPGWHKLSSLLFFEPYQVLEEEDLSIVEASYTATSPYPPVRHTADSLIVWLDESSVGRPHNYSSAISYLLEEEYAKTINGRIGITSQGEAVLTFLKKSAPDLIDPDFHAELEEEIESVSDGSITFAKFANDYWAWVTSVEEKMKKSLLRPKFTAPGGSKARVWVDSNKVFAVSRKEDWMAPIGFDSKGKIYVAKASK